MKKRFLALLAAGTLLLTGCGAQGAANSNAEAGGDGGAEDNLHHLTVVLDWYPNALHAFLYEAQEKGYFAEQGLDVDIQSPAGVNDAMSMVAAGKADIGLYYQQDVIQARAEQNVPIKSIGAVVQGPLNIVLSLKDKNITSPKDLEGKTVGYAGTELSEALIRSIMKNSGADPDSDGIPCWEEGCLFTITEQETGDNELNGARNTVTFDAQKWRSALGAYFFCDCTASQDIDGRWGDYTVGSQAIS